MSDYVYNNGELYHARNYSHKYIKREWKNGHWVYWYKTDINNGHDQNYDAYIRDSRFKGIGFAKRSSDSKLDADNTYAITKPIGGGRDTVISKFKTADDYRKANKAGSIYREGLESGERDYKFKTLRESKKKNAAKVNLAAHSDPKKYVDNYVNSTRGKYLKVSKEYLNALASNSRKNDYFGKGSNPGIVRFESTRPKRVSNKDRVKNWLRDKLGWK